MKKSLLLPFLLAFIAVGNAQFSDTTNSNYSDSINFLQQNNIIEGYSDGTFRPDNTINRAEFVKILVGSQEISTPGMCRIANFADAPMKAWFGPFIQEAKCQNWIVGYPDGKFYPAKEINYAEASKIVVSVFEKDVSATDVWYQGYIDAIKAADAEPRTNIEPSDSLTRGEMAFMIETLMNSENMTPSYIGLSVEAAEQLAEKNGVRFRIGSEDGQMKMTTKDWVLGRITADVEDGIVVDYTTEGETNEEIEEVSTPLTELSKWHLIEYFNGEELAVVKDLSQERNIIFQDGTASGKFDCNNAAGSYVSTESGGLEFGPMATTRMACIDSVNNPSSFEVFGLLDEVNEYEISENLKNLILKDSEGQVLLKFLASDDETLLYSDTIIVEVGPEKVDCYGSHPMECLVVDGSFFYDTIQGFEHETGKTYQLEIKRTKYCEPAILNSCPMDASYFQYELIEVLSEEEL